MDVIGVCHLCRTRTSITWCPDCWHWFCEACKGHWFWRGLEYVKEIIHVVLGLFPYLDQECCGPQALTDDELSNQRRL